MKKPHKHADLIKAWADGAEIQVSIYHGEWQTVTSPCFDIERASYRIKPDTKEDIVKYVNVHVNADTYLVSDKKMRNTDLKLTFDGETRNLKSAEIL